MANNMEYCSFVSTHCIVCDCGSSFPSEEALKEHLDRGHADEDTAKKLPKKVEAPKAKTYKIIKPIQVLKKPRYILLDKNSPIRLVAVNKPNPTYILENQPKVKTNSTYIIKRTPKQTNTFITPDNETEVEEDFSTQNVQNIETATLYQSEEHQVKSEVPDIGPEIIDNEALSYTITNPVTFTEDLIKKEHIEHDYHKEEKQQATVEEFFYCEVCGKTFTTVRSLALHMSRMHLRRDSSPGINKKAVCDICGKNYSSNAALRYHMRVHTGERPYACTECPKAFAMPLFLQIHMRTHTGERPYECQLCPKAFSSKAALLRHDRVHTGIKPYECPQCLKTFSQSNSMKLHFQTVHLKMPAPYKSAARKLKSLKRQELAARSELTAVRINKPKGKNRSKLVTLEEMNLLNSKAQHMSDEQSSTFEYVVEETPFDEESDKDYVYQEVFIPE